MNQQCTYVSQTWGVHDQRWVDTLVSLGFSVQVWSCERDDLSIDQLRELLSNAHGPVLAGPLTTITRHLIGITQPLIGLSWGFDLLQLNDEETDLSWLRRLDGLIVDSAATRDIALQSGLPESSVHTIPWGVDLEKFTPDGPAMDLQAWTVPESASVVLSLRALEPLYRVTDIIDGFAEIAVVDSDVHLVIGNDGSLRQQLEARLTTLGISDRVTFIGRHPESDLPGLLRAATVYVTASEVDGSSVTLLQAMASGVPVIASATPGNEEWIIHDETGYLFTTGSPQELASSLRLALDAGTRSHNHNHNLTGQARELVRDRADWKRNLHLLGDLMNAAASGDRQSAGNGF